MRKILEKVASNVPATLAVTLEHSDRQKSRGLLRLDDGSEAALLLERGSGLCHGDRLLADDGVVVLVQAALEGLSVVTAVDPLDLARAAYHLGNRHVAVQIEGLRLAFLHDHVLDDMLRELGLRVAFAAERFEPESGAYGHGHAHVEQPRKASLPLHSHGNGHAHSHEHAPAHEHDAEHAP
ncbi:MAG TPA: urease accessory protein UreE [Polyangiaceae bacterium]|jgi:urease accessory protein|nr:urease accessory protein UreE [Polyangiaceae bacterium]